MTATKKRKPGAASPEAAVYEIHHGDWAGWTLADLGPRRKIQARSYPHHAWRPAPLRLLTRSYPVDDPVWDWLRAHGAVRQSPSGPSGTTQPEAERHTVQVLLRLVPEDRDRLRALAEAEGVTVSGWVAEAVRRAR